MLQVIALLGLSCALEDSVEASIRTLARPLVESEEVPGVVIGWIAADGTEHLVALGRRGRDDSTPLSDDAIFEIGSLTKLFTGLTFASLVTTKEIDPHATIDTLLPEKARPKTDSGVELIQLASHRGGMPEIAPNLERDMSRFVVDYSQYDETKLAEFLRGFAPSPKPGRRYVYSNFGFGVLGYILAQHEKQPLSELVAKRVTKPLGLDATGFEVSPTLAQRSSVGHDPNGDPVPPMEFAALAGCGGMRSSAADLLRFARAFLEPKGELAAAIEYASTPVAKTPQGVGIGLDWMLALDGETFFHSGQTAGFSSFLCFHREKHIGVVVLTNGSSMQVELLGVGVLRTLLGVPVTPLSVKSPVRLAEAEDAHRAEIQRRAGKYAMKGGPTMEVTAQDGRLYAQLPGQPAYRLLPLADGTFVYRSIDASVTFEIEGEGSAQSLVLHQNRRDLSFERID